MCVTRVGRLREGKIHHRTPTPVPIPSSSSFLILFSSWNSAGKLAGEGPIVVRKGISNPLSPLKPCGLAPTVECSAPQFGGGGENKLGLSVSERKREG